MKDHIPKDQVAYQKGRNTTEQVMCMRLLIGKAITSENYNLIIMMIDTSKTLDTVNRKTLLKTLETILDESEMRMMYLLINNIKRKVKVGRSLQEEILTSISVAQGDCLSVLLFLFYLAKFVDVIPGLPTREKFGNKFLWSELDLIKDRDARQVVIDPKCADNISFIRTNEIKMNQVKRLLPDLLKKGNLTENELKREEFGITDEKDLWKKCKCQGSLMDTKSVELILFNESCFTESCV